MEVTSRPAMIFFSLVSICLVSSAQRCPTNTCTGNRVFSYCKDLPYLQAHLYWNYVRSTGKVEIAYRATRTSEGWIAWAINPTEAGMDGSQALNSFRNANGSITVYPTPITSYNPSMQPGALSFQVLNVSAEYSENKMTIFAVIGPLHNRTIVNHVWQAGSSVTENIPRIHPTSAENLQSMGSLDFLLG